MAEIRCISKEIVQTVETDHGEFIDRVELTTWDLQILLVGPIQKGLLFLKPTPFQEKQLFANNNLFDHLKASFSRALEFFPPLTGRLCFDRNEEGDTGSFYIDCNNAGACFIHTVVDNVTVKDILEPVYTPRIVQSFFPMNGKLNIEGISNPLLAVQVNELVDGFFIGCTMNHSVVDGTSFWHFFNSWAEISRGYSKITRLPVFKRWFPNEINPPLGIPFSSCLKPVEEFISPPLEERVFHFPKHKIAALKAKANAEMNTTGISSLQALLAHLWRHVIRCQKINDLDQEVKCNILVGARPRLPSSLPEGYFGNAIHPATVNTTVGELLNQGLGETAYRMHQVIASQSSDKVENYFKNWAQNPNFMTMSGITKNTLITSSIEPELILVGGNRWLCEVVQETSMMARLLFSPEGKKEVLTLKFACRLKSYLLLGLWRSSWRPWPFEDELNHLVCDPFTKSNHQIKNGDLVYKVLKKMAMQMQWNHQIGAYQ